MRARFRWSVGLPVLVALAVSAVVLTSSAGADPVKRPAGLELVPTEGFAVLTVNVAAVHDAGVTKPLREAFEKGDRAFLKRIEADTGFTPDQIDRLTVLLPTASYMATETPMVVISTRKPIDKAKVLKAWKATTEPNATFGGLCGGIGGPAVMPNLPGLPLPPQPIPVDVPPAKDKAAKPEAEKPLDLNASLYYTKTDPAVLIPIDDHTLVYLPNGAMGAPIQLLAGLLRRKADGPLVEALALADKHHVTAAVDGKHLRETIKLWREGPTDVMVEEVAVDGNGNVIQPVRPMKDPTAEDEFTPYEPLAQLDRAVLTLDVGPRTTLRLVAHYPTAEAAKKAEPSAKEGLKTVVKLLTEERKAAGDSEEDKALVPVHDFALAGVQKATVTVEGKTLTVVAAAEVSPALTAAMAVLPQKVVEAADRIRTSNNLKQIGLALHSYHDSNGHFPQDMIDGDGKVLLSWRVQLLPYLEGNDLFGKIDMGRAWDDPVNKKLWDQMPDVFRVPGREGKEKGHTFFQAYRAVNWVGQGDCWLVDNRKVTMTDITDGTSQTVAVIETEDGVNWMKPGDILLDPKKLPKIGNPKTGKANAAMLDGSTMLIDRKKYEGDKVLPLITVNGGETIELGGR
jgi:Protein of unknown function (DUF1559)